MVPRRNSQSKSRTAGLLRPDWGVLGHVRLLPGADVKVSRTGQRFGKGRGWVLEVPVDPRLSLG
jgi:hypothetical protein